MAEDVQKKTSKWPVKSLEAWGFPICMLWSSFGAKPQNRTSKLVNPQAQSPDSPGKPRKTP